MNFIPPVWLAFICGIFIGSCLGMMIIGLLSMCREDEEEYGMANPKITAPTEDMFHKYPVLKIPTGKRNEILIIGREKAEAIIRHYGAIREFVEKHTLEQESRAS